MYQTATLPSAETAVTVHHLASGVPQPPGTSNFIKTFPGLSQWPLLGSQFVQGFDFRTMQLTFLSDTFWQLTDHPPQEPSLQLLYCHIHPEDQATVLQATILLAKFAETFAPSIQPRTHVFSIDYRFRKADGSYLRILQQTSVLEKTAEGSIVSCLSVCSDITQQKKTTDIHFGMNHPAFSAYAGKPEEATSPVRLSHREEEILKLLMAGQKTRDIAKALHLSAFTVDTHRKNMKKKLNFHNTAELVGFAFAKGL